MVRSLDEIGFPEIAAQYSAKAPSTAAKSATKLVRDINIDMVFYTMLSLSLPTPFVPSLSVNKDGQGRIFEPSELREAVSYHRPIKICGWQGEFAKAHLFSGG